MELPSFAAFYESVHGRAPFPWQQRLAERVADEGWPREIGVPTGLGKTSCLDVAVWSLAAQADRSPADRTVPTRIWYVVNRRLLVDAASDHAARLAALLTSSNDVSLAAVAARLRAIEGGITGSALTVSRMRGGSALDARPPHPGHPAIICATVPMYASRLLFRGYGSSNRMWPVDAALAGTDALVLLDEAHLSQPLMSLLERISACDARAAGVLRFSGRFEPGEGPMLLPLQRSQPLLVALTATGDRSVDRFDLDEADLQHPVVQRRLSASKPTWLVDTTSKAMPETFANIIGSVVEAAESPPAVLAFVNRPASARLVAAAVAKRSPDVGVVVLTGQLRDPDADRVRALLLDDRTGLPAGRVGARSSPLVVVATQTLEVGADLDADHLVTESAGVRALVQRLGRLNRLGERHGVSAHIVHPVDGSGGLYGDEPNEVVDLLGSQPQPVDLSPGRIAATLGSPADLPPQLPELLPVHLWEWAKTSVPPRDAAPIELFYEGFERPDASVSVAWREVLGKPGDAIYPIPHRGEWVDVPVGELRALLGERGPALLLDVDGATLREVDPEDLRPGGRVIVASTAGGYSSAGWDPASTERVADLSAWLGGAVILVPSVLEHSLGVRVDEDLEGLLARLVDPDELPTLDEETEIAARLWNEVGPIISTVLPGAVLDGIDRVGVDARPWLRWSASGITGRTASDALDELSIAPSADLDDHLAHVADLSATICAGIGIAGPEREAVRRAAGFHDLGKADARFQRWLAAPPGRVLAKSPQRPGRWLGQRVRSGWPLGGRHELLSVQLLDAAVAAGLVVDDLDLVRHLVISHHGHGRPTVGAVEDAADLLCRMVIDGIEVQCVVNPATADWDQPSRFRTLCERYGLWGLALLEAIVRQSDHIVSAVTEVA